MQWNINKKVQVLYQVQYLHVIIAQVLNPKNPKNPIPVLLYVFYVILVIKPIMSKKYYSNVRTVYTNLKNTRRKTYGAMPNIFKILFFSSDGSDTISWNTIKRLDDCHNGMFNISTDTEEMFVKLPFININKFNKKVFNFFQN